MTLIIYHKKAIYADRCVVIGDTVDAGSIRKEEKKLYVSPDREKAFVVCGDRPDSRTMDIIFHGLHQIFNALAWMAEMKEEDDGGRKIWSEEERAKRKKNYDRYIDYIEKSAEVMRSFQDGRIFAITSNQAILLDLGKEVPLNSVVRLFSDGSSGYGTGSDYWNLFHGNDCEPEECYEHVWKIEDTVSRRFDKMCMSDLVPFTEQT